MDTPSGTAVVVVGMHRSGTSALTQLLAANGFRAGGSELLLPANFSNVHGHFELVEANAVNNALLHELGASWFAPPTFEAVESVAGALSDGYAERMRLLLASVAGDGPPVVKDPRATLVLPVWVEALPQAVFVACVRNPLSVARSLAARDSSPLPLGLALWEIYNAALLRWLPAERSLLVDVDAVLPQADARQQLVHDLQDRTGLQPVPWDDTYDAAVLHAAPSPGTWRQYVTGQQEELLTRLTSTVFENAPVPLDGAREVLARHPPNTAAWPTHDRPAVKNRVAQLEADLATARTESAAVRQEALGLQRQAQEDRRRLELDVLLARAGSAS